MSIGEVELKRVDEEGLSTRIIEDERLVEEEENGFLPSGSTMPVRASLLTQSAKYVLLFTSFVDILGFSLPNPLMPYYFSHLEGFSKENSGAVYGLIMSSFSIGQFLGSLGAGIMSDKFGRRLPILICLLGNCLFLIYTGFAPSVAQLIMARGMAGLFAGTQSVCSAYGKQKRLFIIFVLTHESSFGCYN
jgi:MFS family permease